MSERTRAGLAVAALVAAWSVQAGTPLLVEAWQGVVAYSPEYASALAQRDSAAAARERARSLWLPTLVGQGGVARRSLQGETLGAQFSAPGFGTSDAVDFRTSVNAGNARQWALLAQQPLVDAGRVADSASARARARIAEAEFRQREQTLMVHTAELLAAVVESSARLQAVQRERDSAARARDLAHARFESGDLPVTEWREAQARADQLAVDELDAQQANAIANESYADLTGLAPPAPPTPALLPAPPTAVTSAPLASAAQAAIEPTPLDVWLQRAMESNPALALQREQRALAEAELRRWSRLDGVQLSLVGQYGRDSLDGNGDYGAASATQRLASVGLQLTVPLFTGGMRSAQRHAADAGLRAASADLDTARQQAELRVRAAWLVAANARARLQATARARDSAASRLDATRIGYDSGDRTLLDLLVAEGAALQAQALAHGARCEGLLAVLRLEAAAGTLDEASLRAAASDEFGCGDGLGAGQ